MKTKRERGLTRTGIATIVPPMSVEMIQRAYALHQGGRLAEAEGLYRMALAGGGGGDAMGWFLLALSLYQQQKSAEALSAVNTALMRDPGHLDSLMMRGALLIGTGQREAALADFAGVTRRGVGRMPPQTLAQAWFNQGVALSELDRPDEAVQAFDRALALGPDPNAWNNRGVALLKLGRNAQALESFDKALAAAPGFALVRYNRSMALHALERYDEALTALDGFLAAGPPGPQALMHRGVILFGLERFAEAVAAYDAALSADADLAAGWSNRGDALTRLKAHAEALASYDRALALDPRRGETWRRRGEILIALRRHAEALESHDRALALGIEAARAQRGDALALLHRYEEAVAVYDVALADTPDPVSVLRARSGALRALRRFDAARADLERALALDPKDPDTRQAYGKLLSETGDIAGAMTVFAQRAADLYGREGAADPAAPNPQAAQARGRHADEQAQWLAGEGIAPSPFRIEGGARIASGAVNRANADKVAIAWAASNPKLVVIDDLLTPEALHGLRRFALGSTVWKKPYRQGYIGAFDEYGFACPLLAQIAEELGEVFPSVVEGHGLLNCWGFVYDSALNGIRIHADQAAVNVNFWITPDEANLDPESGGMVVWDAVAPED